MKKILAFVLALVMVLGMVTVVSAASTKIEATKWDLENDKVYLKITSDETDFDTVYVDDCSYCGNTHSMDTDSEYVLGTDFGMNGEIEYEFSSSADTVYVWANTWDADDDGEPDSGEYQLIRIPKPDDEVVEALEEAYFNKEDTVVVDLTKLADPYVVTAADWDLLLNNYFYNGMWWDMDYFVEQYGAAFYYTKMNIKFVDPALNVDGGYRYVGGGNAIYYIAAADVDYFFSKDVDFTMTNGCVGYDKDAKTIWNTIRKLTADVNPYTFGWTSEQSVMKMTVSVVIPQAWINAYGHKGLSLWAYNAATETKCAECGAVLGTEAAKLAEDVADANTITQRITFTTNKLYKTMVLSTGAAAAAEEAAATDANPNTGANDIVNVAIVLSVISLVAAGAFVFSKQR